jgi:hypothetical protein
VSESGAGEVLSQIKIALKQMTTYYNHSLRHEINYNLLSEQILV